MDFIKTPLRKSFVFYSMVGLIIRWGTYLAAFLLGLTAVGPFLTSTVFKSLLEQVAANPLLGYLLAPEDWILDQLIRNVAVLFAVWMCAFFAYWKFNRRVDDLNIYLGYLSSLTRGVGALLIALFMLFAGIGLYPILVLHEGPTGLYTVLLALLLFGLPGLFFNYYAKVGFKPSRLLDVVAPYAAVLCGLLTAAAMIYGAVADVVGLLFFLLRKG